MVSPLTLPEFGASRLGAGTFANDGAAGGREGAISGWLPVITFGLGLAGGASAVVFFAIFFDARAEGLRSRFSLRATLRGALIVGFRFATAGVCEVYSAAPVLSLMPRSQGAHASWVSRGIIVC